MRQLCAEDESPHRPIGSSSTDCSGTPAIGTPTQCAIRLREFIDLGVDVIRLRGASPKQSHPVVDAYRAPRRTT